MKRRDPIISVAAVCEIAFGLISLLSVPSMAEQDTTATPGIKR